MKKFFNLFLAEKFTCFKCKEILHVSDIQSGIHISSVKWKYVSAVKKGSLVSGIQKLFATCFRYEERFPCFMHAKPFCYLFRRWRKVHLFQACNRILLPVSGMKNGLLVSGMQNHFLTCFGGEERLLVSGMQNIFFYLFRGWRKDSQSVLVNLIGNSNDVAFDVAVLNVRCS